MQFNLDFLERAHAVDIGGARARNLSSSFELTDVEFIKTYRLNKEQVRNLIAELEPFMPRRLRSDGIDTETKILVALAFYAVGSYQTLVGQSRLHKLSQPSVSKAIHQVTSALNHPAILNKYIVFPLTRDQRERIKSNFYQRHGMPGAIGCIDGTHIALVRPKVHEERYFNRKGYHSLNVQLICDSDLKIMSVDASHPGSAHDSTIWALHPLKPYLESLVASGEDLYLLGDSGYPLRRTMMTPILHAAPGSPEAYFYESHVSTRNLIERCIGVLKARFRCLLVARTLHYDPTTAARIVNACCVLHNIAHSASIELPQMSDEERAEIEAELRANPLNGGAGAVLDQDRSRGHQRLELQRGRYYRQALVDRLWDERHN